MSLLERRVALLEQRLQEMDQLLGRVPLRDLPPTPPPLFAQIIGGQTVSAVPMIQYVTTGALYLGAEQADQLYNPLTATSYIAGLGNGTLWANGVMGNQVLIRHNWQGLTDPLISGARFQVGYPYQLSVVNGGGVLTVYPIIGV